MTTFITIVYVIGARVRGLSILLQAGKGGGRGSALGGGASQGVFGGGGGADLSAAGVPANDEFQYWVKLRLDVEADGTATAYLVRPSGPTEKESVSGDLTDYESMTTLVKMLMVQVSAVTCTGYLHIARGYTGESALGWPSDA